MDDTTQVLLNVLKSHFETSPELSGAWKKAPELTLMHLSRPGWPAEFLTREQKALVFIGLEKLSKELFYSNDMKSLLRFAQNAVALVLKYGPQKSKTRIEKNRLASFIKSEQLDGQPDRVAAARAAARYLNTKKREQAGKSYVPADPGNRLLEILSLPKSMATELPKQDIRGLILKNSLADLIKQASCFSPDILRPILGEDLSKYLKPVGFADKAQKTILIEVKSSAVAHEMTFRKPEIIRRLRQLKEFESVTDIRFQSVY
jgi:hypothetical protein